MSDVDTDDSTVEIFRRLGCFVIVLSVLTTVSGLALVGTSAPVYDISHQTERLNSMSDDEFESFLADWNVNERHPEDRVARSRTDVLRQMEEENQRDAIGDAVIGTLLASFGAYTLWYTHAGPARQKLRELDEDNAVYAGESR